MKNAATSAIYATMLALLWTCLFCIPAAWAAGSIDETHKYAWSENTGWHNWRSSHAQVTVEADHLKGFVWAENIGWIKLGVDAGGPYGNDASTNWGVNRDSNGVLSGYAWSENVGWINFNPSHGGGVTIDPTTGDFSGYAWGENIGWLKFAGVAQNSTAYKVKWTASQYTVTFDKQNGTGGSNSVTATYGSAMPTATAPARGGYTLVLTKGAQR